MAQRTASDAKNLHDRAKPSMNEPIRLLFLGTGAAVPSPRRALPTLALLFPGEIALCDCSEGTQQRLAVVGLSPSRIRHIFISHLHGDHIFGLPGLLTTQHLLARQTPIDIWGPAGIARFIEGVNAVTGHRCDFPLTIHEFSQDEVAAIALEQFSFSARRLEHSKECYGFRLCTHPRPGRFDQLKAAALGIPEGPQRRALLEGFSIQLEDGRMIRPEEIVGPERPGDVVAYCTDTRPCAAGVALARGADVLLHDSTFSPGLQALAQETGHSTAVEAAEVARQAGVKHLLLWHISGRHDAAEVTEMVRQAQEVFTATSVPEDFEIWAVPGRNEE
jgi:ribonuclease Z